MATCVAVGRLSSWELSACLPSANPLGPWSRRACSRHALHGLCIRILCVDRMCECACLSASRWHAQFLGGVAAKRWGCRAVLSLGVLGSGLACMLTPLAASHSWTAAFAMRVTAGVVFPCTCKGPLVMHRIIVVVVCVCIVYVCLMLCLRLFSSIICCVRV